MSLLNIFCFFSLPFRERTAWYIHMSSWDTDVMTSFLSLLPKYLSLLILIVSVTFSLVFCQVSDQQDESVLVTIALKATFSPQMAFSLPVIETVGSSETQAFLDKFYSSNQIQFRHCWLIRRWSLKVGCHTTIILLIFVFY